MLAIPVPRLLLNRKKRIMKNYTLVLTIDALNVIGKALHQMPFGIVAPVIKDIERQLAEQSKPEIVKSDESEAA